MAFKMMHITCVKCTNAFHHCKIHGILVVYNERFYLTWDAAFFYCFLPREHLECFYWFNIIINEIALNTKASMTEEGGLIDFSKDIHYPLVNLT